jgi:hypothetical protein
MKTILLFCTTSAEWKLELFFDALVWKRRPFVKIVAGGEEAIVKGKGSEECLPPQL